MKTITKLASARPKILFTFGVTVVVAVSAAVKGRVDTGKGRALQKESAHRLDIALAECDTAKAGLERVAREYGEFQMSVDTEIVAYFAHWLEQNGTLVSRLNFKKVDGVTILVPDITTYAASDRSVTTAIMGLASGVAAGVAAPAAALWGVSALASASTGKKISSLRGIAAENAARAWLGGGPLADGGGGVAAGTVVLGAGSIIAMLVVGGFTVGVVGAQTRTRARDRAATAEIEIAQIALVQDLLAATEKRIEELQVLLSSLAERAARSLDTLYALDFDPDHHATEFLRALQLVTAVKEVLNTPVLSSTSDELTEASIQIQRNYE